MKFRNKKLLYVLLFVLIVGLFSGCGKKAEGEDSTDSNNDTESTSDVPAFNYSEGMDADGKWEGVVALDYVELLDFRNVEIPADIHTVTDEAVDIQIDSIMAEHVTDIEITDRAVVDGDTLNIDYVGSVDGVEFEGGSTNGAGSRVTIGQTSFIDDFLEQLIGHNPGETFDIEVTFPADYTQEDLKGKDAVFNVTINHIIEINKPELTDAFVAENMAESNGWTNIAEMKEGVRDDLENTAIMSFIQETIVSESNVKSIPDFINEYNEKAMINSYAEAAASYGVTIEELITNLLGMASIEKLIEAQQDAIVDASTYSLVTQAIAEDAEISVSDEEVADYFAENMPAEDFETYKEKYGLPYLKRILLNEKVLIYVKENATLL